MKAKRVIKEHIGQYEEKKENGGQRKGENQEKRKKN